MLFPLFAMFGPISVEHQSGGYAAACFSAELPPTVSPRMTVEQYDTIIVAAAVSHEAFDLAMNAHVPEWWAGASIGCRVAVERAVQVEAL
jgi:hypothetical protein